MPASTCWQWRAARPGRPAGERLGHGGRHGGGIVPGGVEQGGGGLQRDEAFGQPVAHRLEGRDGTTELRCAPARARGRARASPVPRRRARSRGRAARGPRAPAQSAPLTVRRSVDIECHRSPRTGPARDRGRAPVGAPAPRSRRRTPRRRRWPLPRRVPRSERSSAAVPKPSTTHRSAVERAQVGRTAAAAAGRRRCRPVAAPSAAASSQSSAAEVACAAPRHSKSTETAVARSASSASRHPRSSSAASSAAPLGRLGGVTDAALEERALGRLHQRSAPRSRRRRAMMLRWISALPP